MQNQDRIISIGMFMAAVSLISIFILPMVENNQEEIKINRLNIQLAKAEILTEISKHESLTLHPNGQRSFERLEAKLDYSICLDLAVIENYNPKKCILNVDSNP